ncbi:hypothetical protein ACS0TY_035078 [Phlomoides rotata]
MSPWGLMNARVVLLDKPDPLRSSWNVESSCSQFTWSTRQSSLGFIAARLDQVLTSQTFLGLWHCLEVTVLARYSLDHHPLLVMAKETSVSTGPRPF